MLKDFRFALHMPPAKLFARSRLLAKRKTLVQARRLGLIRRTGMECPAPPLAAEPPEPLFTPDAMVARRADGGFSFDFLNHREDFDLPIDWRRPGLQTGTRLWLLNLHYMEYLPRLSDADFEALVGDWIASVPPFLPSYWMFDWNAYALSIRVVALMGETTRRGPGLSPGFLKQLNRSIANQLFFLERNLETDIGGNHIIKNIKALAWGGAYFAGPHAARWRARALSLLRRELEIQILPDGMHYERSASYHAQVFADLLETGAALGRDAPGGALDDALAQMLPPLADLTHPDGGPALFNDAGLNMAGSPVESLAAYARLAGPVAPPRAVFDYPAAGYYGRRDDLWYLAADLGQVGPDDLPAHAHGDIGSFELSVGGHRLIVDPGVFEYNAGERRMRSRTAATHNVLHIDGGDQAEFFGAFRCGRRPKVTAAFQRTDEGFDLQGSHDGYSTGPGGIVHHRLRAGRRGFRIDDRIAGDRSGAASIGVLLHPEAAPARSGDAVMVERAAAKIVLRASLPIAIEDAVHWPDMGVERPTRRLLIRLPAQADSVSLEIDIQES